MGTYLVEPAFDREVILYADCPAQMIKAAKTLFDTLGHYARPDVLRLHVRREPDAAGPTARPLSVPRDELRRISERYEIPEETLVAILADLTRVRGE